MAKDRCFGREGSRCSDRRTRHYHRRTYILGTCRQANSVAPFYNIPAFALAVPPQNGTVSSLTQILGSTFSNDPMR